MYHASQQTLSADGLQHNSQHRKMRGIKTAICAPSIRPDLCIWSRGFSGICSRASLTSFRGCDPHVAIYAENGGLPPRHRLKLGPWLKDNTRAIAASATKKQVTVFLFCQRHGPWICAGPTEGSHSGGGDAHRQRLSSHACLSP